MLSIYNLSIVCLHQLDTRQTIRDRALCQDWRTPGCLQWSDGRRSGVPDSLGPDPPEDCRPQVPVIPLSWLNRVGLAVFKGCAISSSLGAQFSVSHPSVNVHYIGTRNVQLMHCSVGDFCWRLGNVQREIEGVGSGEGLRPSPVWVWGLAPRENFEIYVNTDANFSISKVKFLAFRGPSQYA